MTKSQKKLLCRDAVVMPIHAVSSSRYSLPQLVEPAYGIHAADIVAHVEANVDSVEHSGVSGAGLAQKKKCGIEQKQPIDLSTPVQRAVEQERMRLARDVHDVSGQYIVAVTPGLAALAHANSVSALGLTAREQDVLRLVAIDYSDKELGARQYARQYKHQINRDI